MIATQRCLQRTALILICWAQLCPSACKAQGDAKRPELLLPLGHTDYVVRVALSGDGKRAMTMSVDRSVIVWDGDTGKPLHTLRDPAGLFTCIAVSRDGKRALTGLPDNTTILWDLDSGRALQTLKQHTKVIIGVAFSGDGKRALTGSGDGTAILWDTATGTPLQTLTGHTKAVHSVALSEDGQRACTGSQDLTAICWDTASGRPLQTLRGFRYPVNQVSLSDNGKRALTAGEGGTAILWNAETGTQLLTLRAPTNTVTDVALSGDGTRALTLCGSTPGKLLPFEAGNPAILWDADTGRQYQTIRGHSGYVFAAALSRDGRRILTGSADHTAILWDASNGTALQPLKGPNRVTSVALDGEGKRILTGATDKTARLWDLATGQRLHMLRGHTDEIHSVALSADGRRAVTGSNDKTAILWQADTGQRLTTFRGHINWVHAVALSPDHKRVLTGAVDYKAIVWDAEQGTPLTTFKRHTYEVFAAVFSGNGQQALTGSADRTAILWDSYSGNPVQTFRGHKEPIDAVALSSDGRHVLTASRDKTAILWNRATGTPIHTLQGHGERVVAGVFSGDGRRVFTGSWDKTAILWDAETGTPLQTFKGHNDAILSVAIAPNNAYLVTSSRDGTVRLWKPGRDEPVFSFLAEGEEWLFWTPEGYYTCSANGEKLIAWRIHDDSPQAYRVVGPEQFRKQFYRPDLFRHLLATLDLTRALARADAESGRNPTAVSTITGALPPYVIIAQPLKSGDIIKTEECHIVAKARATGDNHVTALQLMVDGRPYRGGNAKFAIPEPKPGEASASWKANLDPGKHRIQVAVESVKGSTSLSEELEVIRADEPEALPKLLVLAVGVSAYTKAAPQGVEYAGSDAQRFLDAQFTHGKALYPDADPLPLTSGAATRADILDAFDTIGKKARGHKNPVTLIFLAGHGKVSELGEFYFLAADSDPQRLRATAIRGADLKDALKNIPGKVIVFLDACHSGAFAGDTFRTPGLTDDLFHDLTAPECGVVVICSSRGREVSQQNNMQKAGMFTLALAEGLSGQATKHKNGAIYLPDLFAYINRRVREMSGDQQHPYSSELNKIGNVPLTRP
jgi:WD40 repeat protein